MSEKRWYTVQELQEILGVSRPTIYNLLKKKEFRWIQLRKVSHLKEEFFYRLGIKDGLRLKSTVKSVLETMS